MKSPILGKEYIAPNMPQNLRPMTELRKDRTFVTMQGKLLSLAASTLESKCFDFDELLSLKMECIRLQDERLKSIEHKIEHAINSAALDDLKILSERKSKYTTVNVNRDFKFCIRSEFDTEFKMVSLLLISEARMALENCGYKTPPKAPSASPPQMTEEEGGKPDDDNKTPMNAFQLLSLCGGNTMNKMFESNEAKVKRYTQFTTQATQEEAVKRLDEALVKVGCTTSAHGPQKIKFTLSCDREGIQGEIHASMELHHIGEKLHLVEFRRRKGDVFEYHKFYKKLLDEVSAELVLDEKPGDAGKQGSS